MSESFVRREPCPSCGFPIGLRDEDLIGAASCPVCAAVIVLEHEPVGHGPGREGMFLAVRTLPPAAKGTQMLVDMRDGRLEVTLVKPAPTHAQGPSSVSLRPRFLS